MVIDKFHLNQTQKNAKGTKENIIYQHYPTEDP